MRTLQVLTCFYGQWLTKLRCLRGSVPLYKLCVVSVESVYKAKSKFQL